MSPIGPQEGFQKSSKPPNLLSVERTAAVRSVDSPAVSAIISLNAYRFVMPRLKSRDTHVCLVCKTTFKRRAGLHEHLTLPRTSDKKPRCVGLKVVIPPAIWVKECLPYYKMDGDLPNLSAYMKKSTGRPRGKFSAIGQHQHRKRRLSNDGAIGCHGTPRLSQDELLELLYITHSRKI